MTWIKICGITNLEDARIAVEAGADAVGFVFWEKSPRRIGPTAAREIVDQLPERVEKVGVFADADQDSAIDVYNQARLMAIQRRFDSVFHADGQKAVGLTCFWRPPKFYMVFSADSILADQRSIQGMIRSFQRWGDSIPPEARELMSAELADLFGTFFLDSGTPGQPGGTGKTFDWNKALPLVDAMRPRVKVVVAGGLNPDNVGEAIRILRPWGVDVASGVEARPGKKDPEKVRAFVKAVREAEKSA